MGATHLIPDDRDASRVLRAARGDASAWEELLARHLPRLRRMVALRLDRRLVGRLDPSDVLQEACLQAATALPGYLERADLPFYLWLRWLTGRTLMTVHRRHLGVRARDAGREVRLDGAGMPEASSAAMAAQLMDHDTRASDAAARAERRQRVREALDQLAPTDREVLVLRHFEELTAAETAQVLGVARSAASKRYVRALRRLKGLIEALPDRGEALAP
jgi:RNA polymerase sigma-70 factor (ECF subfamily)